MEQTPYPFLANPQLVLELAMGIESPEAIVERHNLNWDVWLRLRDDPAFQSQVEAKKAELKREGYTFRAKCAMAAEDLIGDVYVHAKRPDVGLGGKLEAAKFFSKMGGLEPKEDKTLGIGAGFMLSIDMGDGQRITIGMGGMPTPAPEVPRGATVENFATDMDLEVMPAYLCEIPLPEHNDFAYAE